MDDRIKEIVRRREAGESWRVINEAIPGAFHAYWKAMGKEARSQTVASKRARASWQKRQDPKERKRAADRAYQARKRAARKA